MSLSWKVFTVLRSRCPFIRPHRTCCKTLTYAQLWNYADALHNVRNVHGQTNHHNGRSAHGHPKSTVVNYKQFPVRFYSAHQSAEKLSMKDDVVRAYAKHLHEKYEEAGLVLSSSERIKPEVEEDAKKSRASLATLSELYKQYEEVRQQWVELQSMLEESGREDKEMEKMLESDINDVREGLAELDEQIMLHIVPPEFGDECDAVLELNAGAGGQEAMLFTEEIYRMYAGYAEYRGWGFEPVHVDESPIGGIKKATVSMNGRNIYKIMKYEGGVHRVQRQPETDKSGRLHTSTMSVAVLPQPTEVDISIHPNDIKLDTFRASGPGGQGVNKSESAVRVTHLPSGMAVECQEGRSQLKNKETALKILRSRLYDVEMAKRVSAQQSKFKVQTGTRSRNEKIRTYNYNQDRVTDHRISMTTRNLPGFMSGNEQLDQMIDRLMEASRLERLRDILDQFEKNKKS